MTEMARKRRWARFIDRQSGKALIVPIDHGLTMGPLVGLSRVGDVQRWLDPDVATGIIAHKGMAERLGGVHGCGLMIHLNGSLNLAETPDTKQMLTSVEAAVRLGADAVSVQTNFTATTSGHNLQLLGRVVDEAHACGMPVLAMVYNKIPQQEGELALIRHFMRAAVELGVDVLKVAAPTDLAVMPELIGDIQDHTPVLFAGGAFTDESLLMELAAAVVRHDAAGICVGRNVFQRPEPGMTMGRLLNVFRRGKPPAKLFRQPQLQESVAQV